MATVTQGDRNRTDVSSREAPEFGKSRGKYNKVVNYSGSLNTDGNLILSGSYQAARAFIIREAGRNTQLFAVDGGVLVAEFLTGSLDTIFEIGIGSVSGSGKIDFLY